MVGTYVLGSAINIHNMICTSKALVLELKEWDGVTFPHDYRLISAIILFLSLVEAEEEGE